MACKGLMPAENPCQSAQAFGTCSPDVRDKPGAFAHARTLEILVCQKPKPIEDEREHSGAPMHDVRMAKFDRCKPVAKSRSFFFSSSAAPAGSIANQPSTCSSVRRSAMLGSIHFEARLPIACRRVCGIEWMLLQHGTSAETGAGLVVYARLRRRRSHQKAAQVRNPKRDLLVWLIVLCVPRRRGAWPKDTIRWPSRVT